MPELPEVETIIRDLKKAQPRILGAEFVDVWTDSKKIIHLRQGFGGHSSKAKEFECFRKEIKGKRIKDIWRRGKNIIFELTEARSLLTHYLLIHQKLTGHLLLGKWRKRRSEWQTTEKRPLLDDPINRFLHLIFWLENGQMLALSDLRKFAKVELLDKETLEKELSSLGPEPLDKNFNFKKFKKILTEKRGLIKKILMDQKVIAGIGNIYSDEILWQAKIHPFKRVEVLTDDELKRVYDEIKKVLKKAIELRGTSVSDYRDVKGEKGFFDKTLNVYRREGKICSRCGTSIERKKIGGRSAHFCPHCQI